MSQGGEWVVGFTDVVDGLMLAGARQMMIGFHDPGDGPCPPPDELPDRNDPDWLPFTGGIYSLPVEVELLDPFFGLSIGPVNPAGCVLYAFDLQADGLACGTLWMVGYPQGVAAPVFLWEHADGVATAWGSAVSTHIAPRVYTDPATDDAPWFDPLDPRSRDVLGVWIDDISIGRPHTRSMQARQHGGSLSATRFGGREITIGGRIYVRTRAAGHYAQQWLYEALVGSPCGDSGCQLPTMQLTQWYDPVNPEAGLVYAHEVGLTDWQAVLDTTEPSDCFVSFTATLSAQVPWLTKEPVEVVTGELLQGDPFCDHCGTTTESGECQPLPGDDPLSCGCGDVPPVPLHVRNNECYVRPIWVARHYVEVPASKLWTDGALRITIRGGTDTDPSGPSARNIRFRVFHDPQGLGVTAGDTFLCSETPCADVSIGCVPFGSTLVIDGALRRGWVETNTTTRSADPYLSSNGGAVVWPEYACGGLVVAVDVDALQTAPDTMYTVETVELQRA